jgi:hypothetical protein
MFPEPVWADAACVSLDEAARAAPPYVVQATSMKATMAGRNLSFGVKVITAPNHRDVGAGAPAGAGKGRGRADASGRSLEKSRSASVEIDIGRAATSICFRSDTSHKKYYVN